MNLFQLAVNTLQSRQLAFVDRFAPIYCCSAGCHILNLENKQRKFYFAHGRIADLRLHVFFIAPSGFFKCMHVDSMIATPEGLKKAGTLQVGEKVFTEDGSVGTILAREFSTRECLLIKTARPKLELICSKEHLVKVRKHLHPYTSTVHDSAYESPKWHEAGELIYRDKLVLTPELQMEETTEWSDERVKALAIWIAEGRISGTTGHPDWYGTPVFCTNSDEIHEAMEQAVEEFDCYLEEAPGMEYYIISNVQTMREVITEEQWNWKGPGSCNLFYSWLKSLGLKTGSRNKFIPQEVFNLPSRQRVLFWEWLLKTDGWEVNGAECYGTSSEQLANDVEFLLMTLGLPSTHSIDATDFHRVFANKKKTANIKSIKNVGLQPTVDFHIDKGSLIANQIVVHNSEVLYQFLDPDTGLISGSSKLGVALEGGMTAAAFVGTVKVGPDGEATVETGMARINERKIVGIEEFAEITNMMKQAYNVQLADALLTALDKGWVRKRLARSGEEGIMYPTNITLWTGSQPARLELSSGLGRRFFMLEFIPSRKERETISKYRRLGRGVVTSPGRIFDIKLQLDSIIERVHNIQHIKFSKEFDKFLSNIGMIHYEEELFERLALGYTVMSGKFDDTLEVLPEPELCTIIEQGVRWRRSIKMDSEANQVVYILQDNGNEMTISEMVLELANFGVDGRSSYQLIMNTQRTGRIQVEGDVISSKWKRKTVDQTVVME